MTETEQDKETAAGKAKENNPEEHNSEERTRMLLADYEARLDEAAELIARVRHEINNPLAALLGQAQLLLREELNEKARKRAEIIEELATRLRDIVAQLREIQRPVKSSVNKDLISPIMGLDKFEGPGQELNFRVVAQAWILNYLHLRRHSRSLEFNL